MELFLLATALSMDSATLCIANGIKNPNLNFKNIFKISFFYAFFQFLMPILGFILGLSFAKFISKFDYIITFLIFAFLGIKMIRDAYKNENISQILSTKELILGAIATSIDAFVIGITFVFAKINVIYACCIIGLVCLIICIFAVFIGKKFGEIFKKKALILGGLILILLGLKNLFLH